MRTIVFTAAVLLILAGQASAAGSARPRATPDLSGMWTTATYTRFERPKAFKSLVITPAEAAPHEAKLAKTQGVDDDPRDTLGQVHSEFNDSGHGFTRVRGQIRTSWVVSPPDGKIPYGADARTRLHIGEKDWDAGFDNVEERSRWERCLASNGDSPPQVPAQDANLVEIVQTPGVIALVTEKNHDVRTVLMRPRDPKAPPSASGNSYGRWDGATLVVETDGFVGDMLDRDDIRYSSAAKVTERFTRLSPTQLLYQFTVVDPGFYAQPLVGEIAWDADPRRMFEYACHEGNYSLPSILKAARLGRQEPPKPAAQTATAAVPPKP